MVFTRMLKGIDRFTDFWISLTLAVMMLVILADIILREVANSPLTWHLEMAQYCLINVTYIGAAVALRRKEHISINLFTAMLPEKKERYVNLIGKIVLFPFLIILVYSSFDILMKGRGVTPSLRLPKWTYYSPIFVGSVCLCIYSISGMVQDIINLRELKQNRDTNLRL